MNLQRFGPQSEPIKFNVRSKRGSRRADTGEGKPFIVRGTRDGPRFILIHCQPNHWFYPPTPNRGESIMKTVSYSIMAITVAAAFNARAADQGLEQCITAIQKQKKGDFVKLEKLNVSGKPIYELEVRDAKGFEWEFMCDVNSGKIIETEGEVSSVNSRAFKSKMKVTEEDAAATALKAYPGVIEEVEYEIEENGNASYEFDIVNEKGVETKVEVDAATGKIIEESTEEWEIGEEDNEKNSFNVPCTGNGQ
jgi:uncharacterized membrane protein YkoI